MIGLTAVRTFAAGMIFSLASCGGESGSAASAPTSAAEPALVTASTVIVATISPGESITVLHGTRQEVSVSFRTANGMPTPVLTGTFGLHGLPDGWSGASQEEFSCDAVMTGNECRLDLTYAPTAATPTGILRIDYLYFDIFGRPRTGNVEIEYRAT